MILELIFDPLLEQLEACVFLSISPRSSSGRSTLWRNALERRNQEGCGAEGELIVVAGVVEARGD